MQNYLFFFLVIGLNFSGFSQKDKPYNPNANPTTEIEEKLNLIEDSEKHLILMVGGNWCPWCRMLSEYFETNEEVEALLEDNFEVVKVNYSKENKNKETLAKYGFPQRFGFPVLVVLDKNGHRVHTQNTVCLEEGKGYNDKRVKEFLKNWSYKALQPSSYK
jgi:thioredoxin-related protein